MLAFFWLALRTLIFGASINYAKEAKSLTFRRGSEVSKVMLILRLMDKILQYPL